VASRRRRFVVCVIAVGVVALGMRVAFVLSYAPDRLPFADGLWYHLQANDIAEGRGFIDPFARAFLGETRASAGHPPLFPVVLAGVSFLGGTSVLAHQLTECVLEALAVVAIGFVGRSVAGDRAGLLAAGIAAGYPRLWVNEGLVLSESLYGLTIALMLLASYRLWRRPGLGAGAQLGIAVGLAALCRGEALVFLPLLVVPLIVAVRRASRRRRVGLLVASAAGALVAIGPWTVANLPRFEEPVLISTSFGLVVSGANCDGTYQGRYLGGWDIKCASVHVAGDESQQSEASRRLGTAYALDHVNRLPAVMSARIGRTWDVYKPGAFERSATGWARGPLKRYGFYVLVPLAAAGAIVLHRRRDVPVFPLLVPAAAVTLTVALTWGSARFRLPADVGFIVLAAVAFDAWGRRLLDSGGPAMMRTR
jgi:4-amino-4-deoxy-L-arabinose transferase-like glycosyltransferase